MFKELMDKYLHTTYTLIICMGLIWLFGILTGYFIVGDVVWYASFITIIALIVSIILFVRSMCWLHIYAYLIDMWKSGNCEINYSRYLRGKYEHERRPDAGKD